MADPFAAPEQPTTPAAPPPAPAISPEIEALIARQVQELSDKRVAGLQSSYDKKLADQQKEFAKLRAQMLGEPEPQEPAADPALASRLAELERQNAILRASQKYPKAAPLYEKLVQFTDAEEQIAFLETLVAQQTPAPPPPTAAQPAEELDVPDIDPNRPAPSAGQNAGFVDGIRMSDDIAKQILNSVKDWPRFNL